MLTERLPTKRSKTGKKPYNYMMWLFPTRQPPCDDGLQYATRPVMAKHPTTFDKSSTLTHRRSLKYATRPVQGYLTYKKTHPPKTLQ